MSKEPFPKRLDPAIHHLLHAKSSELCGAIFSWAEDDNLSRWLIGI